MLQYLDKVIRHPIEPVARHILGHERINLREVGSDESFWTIKAADQSPPFYELLSKVSVVFLGDGETSIRAVSAIAALVFLAWLGWRACKHRGTTLGMVYLSTLAMCAASGFMTFYAREARAYSLGAALAGMMAVLFLERALRGWRQAPLPGWPETGLLVAAAMTHYNLTVLSALILAAYSAEAWRRRDWPALLRMSLVPLALLAWLALSYHSFLLASQGYFGWVKLGYGEAFWVGLRGIGRDALGWPTTAVVIMALITAVLFTMHPRLRGQAESSDAAAVPREKWMNATLALFLLAASYFMAVTLIMKESGIFHLRHYLFLLPIIHVLIAIAISRIWKNMHWLGWLFLIAGTLTQCRVHRIRPSERWRCGTDQLHAQPERTRILLETQNSQEADSPALSWSWSAHPGLRSGARTSAICVHTNSHAQRAVRRVEASVRR